MINLLDKYPNLAAYMATFKKGLEDLHTYKKFMRAFQALQKSALNNDEAAHNKMLELGFVKDPNVKTHYVTKPETISLYEFYKVVNPEEYETVS
jgi:hypothetical protein